MGVSIEVYRQRIGCFVRALSSFKARGNNSNTYQKQSKDSGTALRVVIRLGCLALLVAAVIQSSPSVLDLTQFGDVEKHPGPDTATQALPFVLNKTNELEKRICDLAYLAKRECHGKSGRKKIEALEKCRRMKVCKAEVGANVSVLVDEVRNKEITINTLKEEICQLEERCSTLYSELLEEREKRNKKEYEARDCEINIDLLKEENQDLLNYIEHIEQLSTCRNCTTDLENKSSTVSEVGGRQRQRKLKELKTRAQRALWFIDSYGLSIQSLSLSDSSKKGVILDLSSQQGNNTKKSKFQDIPNEDKEKVKEVLHIMDKFCIGDAAYHALSVQGDGLPKSYLIKQCRNEINRLFAITRTPGELVGAQLSFKDELTRQIKEKMKEGEHNSHKVKISGDGAKMSRISSYIVMSFALLADRKEVMSVKGNHAFAIVCGKECYKNISVSFQNTFDEINELIQAEEIEVEGKTIKLEFFLGGDYKFLLLILGMNAANSNYSCIYCKIHKDQRWDMSKPESFYWSNNMQRKLEENKKLCKNKTDNYGCIYSPLLNIPIENVKVDELHLLLRITDILERNIILTAIKRDLCEDKNKKSNEPKGLHLQNVVKSINSCGVTFSVWEKLDGNGKKTSKHEWTSLVGDEKKKLLRTLPPKFDEILKPETCVTVKQIWQDFGKLYNIITDWTPTQQQKDSFFGQATEWVKLFLTLKDKEVGYAKGNITPYIHVLVYHVPRFFQNSGVKIFTGQGVEKTNDVVRSIYHNKCNKHDGCKDTLLALKRLDCLKDNERKPNKYTKKNEEYWSTTIYDDRRKRPRLSNNITDNT